METLDPDRACQIHDGLNDQMIEWRPHWAAMYREHGTTWDEGGVSWDGRCWTGGLPSCTGIPATIEPAFVPSA